MLRAKVCTFIRGMQVNRSRWLFGFSELPLWIFRANRNAHSFSKLAALWISSANKKQGRLCEPPRFNIANLGNMRRFADSYCLGEHRHKPLIQRVILETAQR